MKHLNKKLWTLVSALLVLNTFSTVRAEPAPELPDWPAAVLSAGCVAHFMGLYVAASYADRNDKVLFVQLAGVPLLAGVGLALSGHSGVEHPAAAMLGAVVGLGILRGAQLHCMNTCEAQMEGLWSLMFGAVEPVAPAIAATIGAVVAHSIASSE